MKSIHATRILGLLVLLLALVAGGCMRLPGEFKPPGLAAVEAANAPQIEAQRQRNRDLAVMWAGSAVMSEKDKEIPNHMENPKLKTVTDSKWTAVYVEAGDDGCHQIPVAHDLKSTNKRSVLTIKARYLAFICADGRKYADELVYDRVHVMKE